MIFKYFKLRISLLFLFSPCFFLLASSFEQPHFFYGSERILYKDHSERPMIDFGTTFNYFWASESFDPNGDIVPLFGKYGSVDFYNFAKTDVSVDSFTEYFAAKGLSNTVAFKNNIKNNFSQAEASNVFMDGKISIFQFSALGTVFFGQNSPFYASIKLPFVFIDSEPIFFTRGIIGGTKFVDYINQSFPAVLAENGFENLSEGFIFKGLSDVYLRCGWNGREFFPNSSFVKNSWADFSLGCVLPFSTFFADDKNRFMHQPAGFAGGFASFAKYSGGIKFNSDLEVNVFGENYAFFKEPVFVKVPLHKNTGMFSFGPEIEASLRRGTFWFVGGDIKTSILLDSILLSVGYSYHSQDAGIYKIEKPYSSSLFDLNQINNISSLTDSLEKKDRLAGFAYKINDFLLNKNVRLMRNYVHVANFGILFRPRQSAGEDGNMCASISCSLPIFGKSAFYGRQISSQCSMAFSVSI